MKEGRTNLDNWVMFQTAFAGLDHRDFEIEADERKGNGNYDATLSIPSEKKWEIARLLMTFLYSSFSAESRPMQAWESEGAVRITVEYPGHLGDPNAEHKY
ncbi:hypothetical protein [Streptomyces sp. NPDC093261]|uniref:hypothetical protein n=1 Tax=Streptomyces sp. NPDC093261 TaxID=3366037 RepID=UPI0037F585DE